MAEEAKTLEDLKDIVDPELAQQAAEIAAPVYVQEIDELGRAYATGRRKDAVARVWIKPGKGEIKVNGREFETYFARPVLRMVINQPFEVAGREGQYDVYCTVKGGGLSGQAGAVRHGISRALTKYEPELRGPLKKEHILFSVLRTGNSSHSGAVLWQKHIKTGKTARFTVVVLSSFVGKVLRMDSSHTEQRLLVSVDTSGAVVERAMLVKRCSLLNRHMKTYWFVTRAGFLSMNSR